MSRTIIASVYKQDSIPELIEELTRSGAQYEEIGIASKQRSHMSFLAPGADLSENEFQAILRDMDLPENERQQVLREFRNNATLLIINPKDDSRFSNIEKMFYDRGLVLAESGKSRKASESSKGSKEDVVLPVTEEELHVGKRTVEKGGVRIHQRVTEKPIHESLRLREEIVRIERRPVDRPVTEADISKLRDGTMELRESAEEAVVSKQAKVVEEVVVRKEVKERQQEIQDKVRRSDVEVEQLSGGNRGDIRENHTEAQTRGSQEIPAEMHRLDEDSSMDLGGNVYNVKGWKVVGVDGEKVGEIDFFLGSPTQNRAYLAVIDCGGFFTDKHVAIPVEQLRFDADDKRIFVPYTKDDLKRSPDYSSTRKDYRDYFDYWRNLTPSEEAMAGSRKHR